VTRKSKAERERYAAELAERDKTRTATPSAAAPTTSRGRGGVARGGRGGTSSRAEVAAAGVFGGGVGGAGRGRDTRPKDQSREEWLSGAAAKREQVEAETAAGAAASAGAGASYSGGQGASHAATGSSIAQPGKIVIAEDEEADVERRDIERIWISSDEEDAEEVEDDIVDVKGKRRASTVKPAKPKRIGAGLGLRPVRAPRTRTAEEEAAFEAHRKRSPSRLKRETTTAAPSSAIIDIPSDEDAMAIDPDTSTIPKPIKDNTTSPELKKKSLAKSRPSTTRRDGSRPSLTETADERAERLRAQHDTDRLLELFHRRPHSNIDVSSNEKDAEAETEAEKLLLFQFPPITPQLFDVAAAITIPDDDPAPVPIPVSDSIAPKIKPDPDQQQQQQQQQQPPPASTKPPITTASTEKEKIAGVSKDESILTAADAKTRLPSGWVGKMHVHRSGRVTMDWGGAAMEVRLGAEVGFLQDAVCLRAPGRRPDGGVDGAVGLEGCGSGKGKGRDNNGESEMDRRPGGDGQGAGLGGDGEGEGEGGGLGTGTAYSLGQVGAKLVVVPDWARLYD
jgi:DNA-directed RNA polymerase III subunit RPC4